MPLGITWHTVVLFFGLVAFTRGGNLLASFHQEGMIRAFAPADPSTSIRESARL